MFARQYFPATYFASLYFPPASDATPAGPLGRFRVGETVTLFLAATPDEAPVGTVLFGGTPVGSVQFSPVAGTASLRAALFVCGFESLGTFTVYVSYSVAGVPYSSTYSFDVVAGGDSGGRVISMAAVRRPEGTKVLAQLSGGRVVQGNRPRP
jgi:hypothetical protein